MAAPRAPLLPLVAALAAGIALGPVATVPPARLIGLAAALLALGLLPLGFSDIALRRLARSASQAGPEARAESPVSEPIQWAPDRMRLLTEVEAYHDGSDLVPLTGLVQLAVYGEAPPLGEGQRVRVEARLHRPIGFRNPGGFDYPALLRRQGILIV